MATLYQYYNTGDDIYFSVHDVHWAAQTFTPAIGYTITSVKLLLSRIRSPGTITIGIRATDVNGKPTGSDLCSGTTDGDTLIYFPSSQWREITLGSGTSLTASTKYAIVMRATSAQNPPAMMM